MLTMNQHHLDAITAALAGDWNHAHNIVQQYEDPLACWIHAVLHKMDGNAENSRYWYARITQDYADFTDPRAELAAIKRAAEEM